MGRSEGVTAVSEQENKAIVRRLVAEWQDGHRREVGEELIADDYVDRGAESGEAGAKAEILAWFDYIWQVFPDFSVQIKNQVAEGDLVATLKTFSGTQKAEFMGIAPTGNRVTFDVFELLRVRDGQVVEHWNVVDMAGMMEQLSAAPNPDG